MDKAEDRTGRAPSRPGALVRGARILRDYLPRGNTLDDETFRRRHLLLCWILGLHIPALFAFALWRGFGVGHAALEVAVPTAALVCARLARGRRVAGFFVTVGLVFCSSVLVHLSDGTIEAHFHFFILVGLIALYQDWVPFLWNVLFVVVSHGLGSGIASDMMFNHPSAQSRPWQWALVHGVAVLAACIGEIVFWKNTEIEQQRSTALVASIAQADADRRAAMSELLVNLARRNQSLLNRQLDLIADLEQRERQPDVLEELFQLDHLATRIRRNAESLLVLSGDEPSRLWGRPVPLGEVARAAAAEVEQYGRVDVLVNDHLEVTGRAVADLAHLLAELLENATTFSPPNSPVLVRSHLAPGDARAFVVSIEDVGIGMSDDEMASANALLAHAPEVDLGRTTMLGFHVVARLASRYGISVHLAATPGGGLTALVRLPGDLVGERPPGGAGARVGDRIPMPAGVGAPTAGVGAPAAVDARATGAPFRARPFVAEPAFLVEPPGPAGAPEAPAEPRVPARVVEVASVAHPVPPPPGPPMSAAPEPPASGLVQRVPGAHLASALRSAPPGVPTPARPSAPASATTPGAPGPGRPDGPRDAERMRSMLSRFQASQRAGRAVATLPTDLTAPPGPMIEEDR